MKTKEEKAISANIASRKYYAKNRETIIAKNQKFRKDKDLPYYVIYGLPNHFYCGVTNNPCNRMASHRSMYKRTTHNYFIMATAETRAEALEIEAEFHDAGWHGRNTGKPKNRAIHN